PQGGPHPTDPPTARRSTRPGPHLLGHGTVPLVSALVRQGDRQGLPQVPKRQVRALLLLLHRRSPGPVLSPHPHLGPVPAPVLLQRPQPPGAPTRPRRDRLPEDR